MQDEDIHSNSGEDFSQRLTSRIWLQQSSLLPFLRVMFWSDERSKGLGVVRLVAAWRCAKSRAHSTFLQNQPGLKISSLRATLLTTQLSQYRNSTSNLCIKPIDRSRLERATFADSRKRWVPSNTSKSSRRRSSLMSCASFSVFAAGRYALHEN